jgi:16S rRNA (cytidine1402-2'-O)-methyltransferase
LLYIVATPIGNLRDIGLRALDLLKTCDYILCEDTRRSRILLRHYAIDLPLVSYHQFNEAKKLESIVADLEAGRSLALISDAGTPAISDPGHRLIVACRSRALPMTVIPGACALIAALVLSGFATDRFQFVGFLPKKSGQRKRLLTEMLSYEGTSICYETAPRLLKG